MNQRLRLVILMGLGFAFVVPLALRSSDSHSQEGPLVVCAVPDAMPRTGKSSDGSPQGLDVAVAQLVANKLGREIEFHWCASAACSWNCIHNRRCDVVIGQPHGPATEVAWSIPYSGSRFGLVVHKDTQDIHSHADLAGKRVGVVSGTVTSRTDGHTTIQFKSRQELLDEFVAKELDVAMVDDDFAAWYLHQHPQRPLRRVAEYAPRERWNMSFAVRAKDTGLLKEIQRALTQVVSSGEINKIFSDQGVAYRAPFSEASLQSVRNDTWERIRERGEFVVSMDPANLPYSSAKPGLPGFDVELAQALARELGVKLRIDWIDIQRETAIGGLLDGECDLALGAAIDPGAVDDEQELAGKVIYSRPYYGTGYLLLTRKDGPHVKSLAELKGATSRRIGTEAGSVADYRLRQQGYLRRLFRTQLSVLKSLHDADIDYGYLWANVGWTLHTSPDFDAQLVPEYVPEEHWNIAVAMRRGDNELQRHVDAALENIVSSGEVSRALARYHVPYFPAFVADATDRPQDASKHSATDHARSEAVRKVGGRGSRRAGDHEKTRLGGGLALPESGFSDSLSDGVIRRQPTDRGLEPQMQRRQTSKIRYGGLDRIRSAGVLVVGLDHNNLPFSAVHPQPAGLDYEIAQLLAKELEVSLQVYWAYSSHDSYPSKLATQRLCDVMLGVMPDDRFGSRVIYSQPYYVADYRFVVAAETAVSHERVPLAVEPGVAVVGLRGREFREYPNLESILAAIVDGTEQAGYVISTRGHWLAQQRFPGKMKFVAVGDAGRDRFPICAAIRKNETDLKEALDQALAEIARSGKLTEIFSRWHIPNEPLGNVASPDSK